MVKRKRCEKGYNCGNACIEQKDACHIEGLGAVQVKVLQDFKKAIAAAKGISAAKKAAAAPIDEEELDFLPLEEDDGDPGFLPLEDDGDPGFLPLEDDGDPGFLPLEDDGELPEDEEAGAGDFSRSKEDERRARDEHSKILKGEIPSDEARLNALKEFKVKDAAKSLKSLENYASLDSSGIKLTDAGANTFSDPDELAKLQKDVENLNEYIDKAPKFNGELYSGVAMDMVDVLGLGELKEGSEFSFPSLTSFSSNASVADEFNGGSIFKVVSNKSGASIMDFSGLPEEEEVLIPKKAKYKVLSIENGLITLEEV